MATDAGELIVKVTADVADIKRSLKDLSDSVENLGAETVAEGNLMSDSFKEVGRLAVKFAKDSFKAFEEQENTLIRLANLVGNDATQSFKKFSEELSNTTNYTDADILSLQAQLAQFGLTTTQVEEATHALIEYAAQTGKDLPEAGAALGQALAGNGRQFRQLNLEIFTTDTRSQRFQKTVEALNSRFGTIAETLRGSTSGAVAGMTNSFEKLEQEFGKFLANPAIGIDSWLTSFIKQTTASIKTVNDFATQVGGLGKVFESVFLEAGREVIKFIIDATTLFGAWNPILKLVGINIDGIKKALDKKIDSIQKDIQATEKSTVAAVSGGKKTVGAISETKKALDEYMSKLAETERMNSIVYNNIAMIAHKEAEIKILESHIALEKMKVDEEYLTTTTQLETDKRLEQSRLSWEANASFSDQLKVQFASDAAYSTKAWVDMSKQAMDAFYSGTAKMIVEGGRFKDVMTSIWKNLAESVIAQIMRMIAEWLIYMAMTGGSGGFGFSAASHFFGGAAEGGMINEPSIITGLRSGRRIIAGEAGPEAIVPTGSANSIGLPSGIGGKGAGGGSGLTINISGQFIEGSAAKWQQFVREQIVPQVRRFTMSTPVGPFNRKRGAS